MANASNRNPPATLSDVARRVGVSRWVAGQVINGGRGNSRVSDEVARRINEAALEVGYHPNRAARLLRGQRSHVFGLLVASAGDPLTSFLVQYLNHESVKLGCHTVISNTMGRGEIGQRQFDYYVEEFAHQRVDGVFCLVHPWLPRDRQGLLEQHPNTVFFEAAGIPGAPCVTVDREAAVQKAVRHLVERGRRRIGLAVMTRERPTCLARRRGYALELSARGLTVDERLILFGEDYGLCFASHNRVTRKWEYPAECLDELVDALVDAQKVDAIIAYDDYMAASLIKRLRRRGIRVPDDVALVGYLNHYLADWTDPALTTIDPRHRVAARTMVRMLERLVTGESLPDDAWTQKIRPRLIVREST